jgi:hypothetical protein
VVAAATALGVIKVVRWAARDVNPSGPPEQPAPETTPGRQRSQSECRLFDSLAEKRRPFPPRSLRTPGLAAFTGSLIRVGVFGKLGTVVL